MEEKINNIPNWLRYILAIPYGILLVLFVFIILQISNSLYADSDSFWSLLLTFLFRNGINLIIFFYGLNVMLPNYKFKITLILSIAFGIFYTFIGGMAYVTDNITIEYILADIEVISCLILSCYFSFTQKLN